MTENHIQRWNCHLIDLFLLVFACAFHLILRARTIWFSNESYIACSPFVISAMLGGYAANRWKSYGIAYGLSFCGAVLASSSWVIEKVLHSPATSFLHDDWYYINYGDDPTIAIFVVIVTSVVATATCGSMGAAYIFMRRR